MYLHTILLVSLPVLSMVILKNLGVILCCCLCQLPKMKIRSETKMERNRQHKKQQTARAI